MSSERDPESRASPPRLALDAVLETASSAWKGRCREIGRSRGGRPILGFEAGRGADLVTLIGGCHADEPVGPLLLEKLAGYLAGLAPEHPLRRRLTWRIVAHANPDGEERNLSWTDRRLPVVDHLGRPDHGYDLASYLRTAVRELPGDDIEFGFPAGSGPAGSEIRPENRAVAAFLAHDVGGAMRRIRLHGSLHGMGLAPGPWFLIERSWIGRTTALRDRLAAAVEAMGYRLFDSERHGEKGFHRIAPGFCTRPDSKAMRAHFLERGEEETAAKFRPSSMEFARSLGKDPLTLVTEMPLFLASSLPPGPVERRDLEALRADLLEAALAGGSDLEAVTARLGVTPMPVRDQMRLQLLFLDEALAAATASA